MKIEFFTGGRDRNISYLIYDLLEKKGFVVDPFENIEIYYKKAVSLDIEIIGVLNTHSHRDHIEGNPAFKKKGVRILKAFGKKKIKLGHEEIEIIDTPGHGDDSVCFVFSLKEGKTKGILTGDVLLVKRVGMVQDDEGSKKLYESLKKIISLSEDTLVYPGHYYNSPFPLSLKEVKKINPYLKAENFKNFNELIIKWREYMRKKFRWMRK